jgi:hypothetical protein
VAGTCQYGKEPSGYIKCGEISRLAGQLLKKDSAPWSKLVSMKLQLPKRKRVTAAVANGALLHLSDTVRTVRGFILSPWCSRDICCAV